MSCRQGGGTGTGHQTEAKEATRWALTHYFLIQTVRVDFFENGDASTLSLEGRSNRKPMYSAGGPRIFAEFNKIQIEPSVF